MGRGLWVDMTNCAGNSRKKVGGMAGAFVAFRPTLEGNETETLKRRAIAAVGCTKAVPSQV